MKLTIFLIAVFGLSFNSLNAGDGFDDEKAKKGFKLFASKGCVTCHGPKGQASTPAAQAMKSRNFAKDPFKQGNTVEKIILTIKNGVPGTVMAPQVTVTDSADIEALAHFVVSVSKGFEHKTEAATPEETGEQPTAKVKPVEPPVFERPKVGEKQISISYAMKLMAKKPRVAFDTNFINQSKGAKLYAENCASCHGNNGEGGVAIKMISAAPYVRVKTEALLGHDGYWMKDEKKFTDLVVKGLPGDLMPGNGTLSKADVKALYNFFIESKKKAK